MTLDACFDDVLAAAQTGASWALTELYRDVHPSVLRYLRSQEPVDGEDVASQVWIDVARSLPRFTGGEDDFRRWIFTIARRRLIDVRRSRARRCVEPIDPSDQAAEYESTDADADPATTVTDGITTADAIAQLRAMLPPDQAEALVLRVVSGLDVAQVASIMGKQAGTVRVLQHRAIRRLSAAGWRWMVTN